MTTLGQNDLDFSLYVLCTVFNINYVENRDDIKTDKKYDIWSIQAASKTPKIE